MDSKHTGLNMYSSGDYFAVNMEKHRPDAEFKAFEFLSLLAAVTRDHNWAIQSYADVGCGCGDATRAVAEGLTGMGFASVQATGYEISPQAASLENTDSVKFKTADYVHDGDDVDLVTLFDVIEHIPEPHVFLNNVSQKCRFIGLHVPLDNTFNNSFRDTYIKKLHHPGHLIFLDTPQALSLMALAGIRVIAYKYTFNFNWPSGQRSLLAKLALPPRRLLAKINPWLTSRTLGSCSLMIIGETNKEWSKNEHSTSDTQ